MFITFEGMDGSGKTTQIVQLTEYLRQNGHHVLTTREPGGTAIGDQIRKILLDNKEGEDMQPRAELLLFCASRAQLVGEIITPHLESGGVVICDRFIDSTYAYQGYGHGLNLESLRHIITFATGGLLPDVTLFLDISPRKALERRAKATLFGDEYNRLDDMEMPFHERVYTGYKDLILAQPDRFIVIDADATPDVVQLRIRTALVPYLNLPTQPSEPPRAPKSTSKQKTAPMKKKSPRKDNLS
ncbi:MAG: dTMP kinase [Anaerolineae bacterium]|nr:dTMP kinase [Anaerolineae bacterium]